MSGARNETKSKPKPWPSTDNRSGVSRYLRSRTLSSAAVVSEQKQGDLDGEECRMEKVGDGRTVDSRGDGNTTTVIAPDQGDRGKTEEGASGDSTPVGGSFRLRGAIPLPRGLKKEDCVVFMCGTCNTVLGDSLHSCGEEKRLDAVACLRVTSDVVLEETILIGTEGALKGCAYRTFSCRRCGECKGVNLYSTPKSLASFRGLFCIYKKGINCYCFKDGSTVPGVTLNFDLSGLRSSLEELKAQILAIHQRLESMRRQLEEVTWKKEHAKVELPQPGDQQ